MKQFLKNAFFGELEYNGFSDLLFKLLIWAVMVIIVLYFIRLFLNAFRKQNVKYKGKSYYMVRDLFLEITSLECIVGFIILFTIYVGFWEWNVRLEQYDWSKWQTYVSAFPQIITYIFIIILFTFRYNNFRNPLKRL